MIDLQSRHIEICDAVVDVLNASDELVLLIDAQRYEDAGDAMEGLEALRVGVLPQAARRKQITRGGAMQLEFDVSLAVLKKTKRGDRDETDRLQLLVEQCAELLEREPLEGLRPPRRTETRLPAPFAPELLEKKSIFLAPITVTYRQYTNPTPR